MTEQAHDGDEAHATGEQGGGVGMAQTVGGNGLWRRQAMTGFAKGGVDDSEANGATARLEQEGTMAAAGALQAANEFECLWIEGHEPLGVEFAEGHFEQGVAACID